MKHATAVRVLVVILATGAAHEASGQAQLEPGVWRMRITSSTNGVPDPVQAFDDCLAAEQLQDPGAYFAPELEGGEADCKRTRQPESDPAKVSYRMQCTGDGFTVDATTRVEVESARRFTVAIRIESRAPGESAIVVANAEGDWIGACEAAPAEPAPAEPAD